MSDLLKMAEALRQSHCNRAGEAHKCVGKTIITSKGVDLECQLCGQGDDHWLSRHGRAAMERAARLTRAAGLDWDALAPERQLAVLWELRRASCPGCGTEKPTPRLGPLDDYYRCDVCDQWGFWPSQGWRSRKKDGAV